MLDVDHSLRTQAPIQREALLEKWRSGLVVAGQPRRLRVQMERALHHRITKGCGRRARRRGVFPSTVDVPGIEEGTAHSEVSERQRLRIVAPDGDLERLLTT